MRYAIVSDIHSNIEALDVAFSKMDPDDGLFCLGDIVGYGPNPNECVERIRERSVATVLGNHDLAAIDNFGIEYFNPAAREAMRWTQKVISKENSDWLAELDYEHRNPAYLLVHGAPKPDYFDYIMSNDGARRAFAATDASLIFIGHTHVAESYALHPDGTMTHRHFQFGGKLDLEPGTRYIVNVGSVGQPRDLNPQGSFGHYDMHAGEVEIVRFDYPISAVQEKIECAHLPEILARRLDLGR